MHRARRTPISESEKREELQQRAVRYAIRVTFVTSCQVAAGCRGDM
jgi:hypothetical protein